jgi:[acyl-carrier-protein] S-malonyltransferase
MTARFAIFCPGQGGQQPHMFDLALSDPAIASQLAQWWDATGYNIPLAHVLHSPSLPFTNRMAQPLIVAASLAMWQAVRRFAPVPYLVAGYSIGELAACAVAGALCPADALALAVTRARLMDDCLEDGKVQGLGAVSGVSSVDLPTLLTQHGWFMAIDTGNGNVIAGGLRQGQRGLIDAIRVLGGKFTPLAVEVAAHTPLMRAAVAPLHAALAQVPFADGNRLPDSLVLTGISAALAAPTAQIKPLLARQVAEPIRWADCMDACAEAGVQMVLELGPGSALARMMQVRHPHVACRSAADFRSLEGIASWIDKHAG